MEAKEFQTLSGVTFKAFTDAGKVFVTAAGSMLVNPYWSPLHGYAMTGTQTAQTGVTPDSGHGTYAYDYPIYWNNPMRAYLFFYHFYIAEDWQEYSAGYNQTPLVCITAGFWNTHYAISPFNAYNEDTSYVEVPPSASNGYRPMLFTTSAAAIEFKNTGALITFPGDVPPSE